MGGSWEGGERLDGDEGMFVTGNVDDGTRWRVCRRLRYNACLRFEDRFLAVAASSWKRISKILCWAYCLTAVRTSECSMRGMLSSGRVPRRRVSVRGIFQKLWG